MSMTRDETIVNRILDHLKDSKKIVDVGCGSGIVTSLLRAQGKIVTPVDVADYRWRRRIPNVIIYDGVTLPFPDQSFDAGLLLMVLHHTPNPSAVFSEVARVSKEIVLIETTYRTGFEKLYTVLTDALANLHPLFYWSSYKSIHEWREYVQGCGFQVVSEQFHTDRVFGVPFLHAVYYLKKMD
jgi:ubiquinone/menaquinone biosynthesis C-methylase UbiE